MRPTVDKGHEELQAILNQLLAEDTDVSVREVARRHSSLKFASAFTRNKDRSDLIGSAQKLQAAARAVKQLPEQKRSTSLTEQVENQKLRIAELERQVSALVASHAACVRAVRLHGGIPALVRFWESYKNVGAIVRELNAVPEAADVMAFSGGADANGKLSPR
jgi:hypothetical protein